MPLNGYLQKGERRNIRKLYLKPYIDAHLLPKKLNHVIKVTNKYASIAVGGAWKRIQRISNWP